MPEDTDLKVFLFPINPSYDDVSSWEENIAMVLNDAHVHQIMACFVVYPLLVAPEPHKPHIFVIGR